MTDKKIRDCDIIQKQCRELQALMYNCSIENTDDTILVEIEEGIATPKNDTQLDYIESDYKIMLYNLIKILKRDFTETKKDSKIRNDIINELYQELKREKRIIKDMFFTSPIKEYPELEIMDDCSELSIEAWVQEIVEIKLDNDDSMYK